MEKEAIGSAKSLCLSDIKRAKKALTATEIRDRTDIQAKTWAESITRELARDLDKTILKLFEEAMVPDGKFLGYTPNQWAHVFKKFPPNAATLEAFIKAKYKWEAMYGTSVPGHDAITEKFRQMWERFLKKHVPQWDPAG